MQSDHDVSAGRFPLRGVEVEVKAAVPRTFRVQQARGMFDLKKGMGEVVRFSVQLPGEAVGGRKGSGQKLRTTAGWRIGAIVGPSGSGKSTVAKAAYGAALYRPGEGWPERKSVLDPFDGELSIKAITGMLTAVGFSSPPAWLRPYGVLSNGEKFRCDLARALLGEAGNHPPAKPGADLVVFDEFTSVVDRTVAKVGSLAVSKAVRGDRCGKEKRLVVVTCHYDILRWLQPDWVLDMASGRLARGALCRRKCGGARPGVELQIRRCGAEWWEHFKKHHYLSGSMQRGSTCYLATWEGEPVGFCAVGSVLGYPGYRKIGRIVVLPDYQGIGIGGRLLEAAAEITMGLPGVTRVGLVTSHPGMIAACARQGSGWRLVGVLKHGSAADVGARKGTQRSTGRAVARFRWTGKRSDH